MKNSKLKSATIAIILSLTSTLSYAADIYQDFIVGKWYGEKTSAESYFFYNDHKFSAKMVLSYGPFSLDKTTCAVKTEGKITDAQVVSDDNKEITIKGDIDFSGYNFDYVIYGNYKECERLISNGNQILDMYRQIGKPSFVMGVRKLTDNSFKVVNGHMDDPNSTFIFKK